jgi:hypothetical protein
MENPNYLQAHAFDTIPFSRGEVIERDLLRLADEHGKTVLCYQCGLSAIRDKQIISCDFCPLHWHLDCTNPPLISAPPANKKWMCPNHVDHVLVRFLCSMGSNGF